MVKQPKYKELSESAVIFGAWKMKNLPGFRDLAGF